MPAPMHIGPINLSKENVMNVRNTTADFNSGDFRL
jgi:hypothetical protein